MFENKKRNSVARTALQEGTHHPVFSINRHRRPRQLFGKWVWIFWISTIIAFIVTESGVIHFRPWQWRFAAFVPSVILLGISAVQSFAPSCDPLDRRWGSLLVITLFSAMAFSYVYVGPVLILSQILYICSFVILFLFLRNTSKRFNLFIESIVVSVRGYGYMIVYGGSWVWLILVPLVIWSFMGWPLAVLAAVFFMTTKGIRVIRGPASHSTSTDQSSFEG